MKKMLILSGVLILSQLIAQSSSQNSTLKEALRLYESRDYEPAVAAFESARAENPQDQSFLPQLALSYKRTGRFEQAASLYRTLVQGSSTEPETFYQFAELLKNEGMYREAKNYYLEYAKTNPVIGNYFAESCDYALQQLLKPSNCKLDNLESNTQQSEYAPVLIDESLLYLSQDAGTLTVKSPNMPLQTNEQQAVYKGIQEILEKETGTLGNITISDDKAYLAFSRTLNPLERTGMDIDTKMEIMFASMDVDGSWKKVNSFPYNSVDHSVGFPCLAEQGKVLYYASNQKGGYGGYDIYVSFMDDKNEWTTPVNMGALINTAGNEIAPYYKNGNLYFSSDRHQGFGGLDVFKAGISNEQDRIVSNLGTCVNTPFDELFFVLDRNGNAYFTSNREGGKGAEDIYKAFQVKLNKEPEQENAPASKPESGTIASQESQTIEKGDRLVAETMILEQPQIQMSSMQQPEKLYFIQLTSLSKYKTSMDESYKRYASFGDVYKVNIDQMVKIRIGAFANINEAIAIMKLVKSKGAKDAFIVSDALDMTKTTLIAPAVAKGDHPKVEQTPANIPSEPTSTPETAVDEEGKYKIRVSEYKAPDWFDVSKISDLGRIEHWTKNGWTIIVLGSYVSEHSAKEVLKKLKDRGFKESYLVVEENGKLYRL